jgi:putative spermidine/putrescine transport system permease protein
MEIGRNSWSYTVLVAILFLFLLAPVLLVFPMAFSNDPYLAFPPRSWGIRFFLELANRPALMSGLRVSLLLATAVTLSSIAVATPAAYALNRLRFPGRDWLMSVFTAPLLLPTIVLGLAILLVFIRLDLIATYRGLLIAHLVIALPYALRVIATSLMTLPASIEDAAASLGAPPLTVFRRVMLPLMAPGIMAAAALCFIVSFDEVVISLFIVGPQLSTFPVEIFRYVESRTDPLIAAASAILVLVTVVLVLVLERSVGVARALGKGA